MTKQSDLLPMVKSDVGELARPVPNVADMLQAVIAGGVTNENVGALEKLVGLYERMETKNAEKQFAAAFVQLQTEMPVIVAKTIIPNRGKYEKFEDLMRVIGPLLNRNGFSVSFSMDVNDNRILETCHLKHTGGHTQSNSFAVRVGRADTETQADCKAATTAKRNALCNALNIVISQDCLNEEDDPRIEGGPISKEKAEEFEHRVKMTNSDEEKFLRLAGAKTYSEIPTSKCDILDDLLSKKEQRGR